MVESSEKRTVKAEAWSGSVADMLRLIEEAKTVVQDRYDSDVVKLTEDTARVGTLGIYSPEEQAVQVADLQTTFEKKWGGWATASDAANESERSGFLAELLTGDTDQFENVRVTVPWAGYGGRYIGLRWSKRNGLTIDIHGEQTLWVESAKITLNKEVEKRAPWWGWLQSITGSLTLLGVLAIAISFIIWGRIDLNSSLAGLVFPLALIAVGSVILSPIYGWILPAFEVRPATAEATGTKNIKWVLGTLAAAIIGAIVSIYVR